MYLLLRQSISYFTSYFILSLQSKLYPSCPFLTILLFLLLLISFPPFLPYSELNAVASEANFF